MKISQKFEVCSLKMKTLMGDDPEFASNQYAVAALKAGIENCTVNRRLILNPSMSYAIALETRFAKLVHSKDLTGTPISKWQMEHMSSPPLSSTTFQWEYEYKSLYGLEDYFEFN